jgi:hypothetical protein
MFIFRAIFWFAVVAVLVPGAGEARGDGPAATQAAMIVRFRNATLAELQRVKAEFGAEAPARIDADPM